MPFEKQSKLPQEDGACNQAIKRQLSKQNISVDKNVSELYLGRLRLGIVSGLSRFKNLQRLWLNDNLLRNLGSSLQDNCRITELYLQGNELVTIKGSLHYLTCLRKLLLHNNQIQRLDETVAELKHLLDLRILNFLGNPVAKEREYRPYVVYYLPQVDILDRLEIQLHERKEAMTLFDEHTANLQRTIGFGNRVVESPPQTCPNPPGFQFKQKREVSESKSLSLKTLTAQNANKRSTREYTRFDWSIVPDCETRRNMADTAVVPPQVITIRFK